MLCNAAIIALVAIAQGDDKIDAALWYAKQTKEQVDKIEVKVDALTDNIGTARGTIDRLEDRIDRVEKESAGTTAIVKQLELWRSESVGQLGLAGSVFAIIMGYATSAFNRWRAKADKSKWDDKSKGRD